MLKTTAKKIARAGRSHRLTWRYVFNFAPTVSHLVHGALPSGAARGVLANLNRDGIAVTSVDQLLGDPSIFRELATEVDRLERQKSGEMAAARAAAQQGDVVPGSKRKDYLIKLLGDKPLLNPNAVFVRFALQRTILQIVNSYYGMYTRLRAFNVWHTLARRQEPTASQLWHRDLDDLHFTLKVFVYLSDVDDGAGPFVYAAGTHSKGKFRGQPDFLYKDGNTPRSNDAQMSDIAPSDSWVKCTGPRGTVVFADTHGYHKGGHAQERDRIVYVAMYSSRLGQRASKQEYFQRPAGIRKLHDRGQAYALATQDE